MSKTVILPVAGYVTGSGYVTGCRMQTSTVPSDQR